MNIFKPDKKTTVKPFLKWAGGKTQLLSTINSSLPKEILNKSFTYIEPFVGSGAVLFWMLDSFPNIKHVVINDANADLMNTYKIIAVKPNELISNLKTLETEYHTLQNFEERKQLYYYEKRTLYNARNSDQTMQAALFIFLNRTCFNGLYRVNRNNEFNVPIGRYNKPMICDEQNILAVSESLKKVEILNKDFEKTIEKANGLTFFYFDPPYKPLSNTSSFNSYSKHEFDDAEQTRLGAFCKKLDILGYKWMLSNADVKGKAASNGFSDELYSMEIAA